jgi:hypothetical protein
VNQRRGVRLFGGITGRSCREQQTLDVWLPACHACHEKFKRHPIALALGVAATFGMTGACWFAALSVPIGAALWVFAKAIGWM